MTERRFVSIWFRHLVPDWLTRRDADLAGLPFVIAGAVCGRMIVTAANPVAEAAGIGAGMVLADARALMPSIEVFDNKPDFAARLLDTLAQWTLWFTPHARVDLPDGLLLDVTGCAHLRQGERPFLRDIVMGLRGHGYDARAAMASTVGAAWAVARYGLELPIVPAGAQEKALHGLPVAALRIAPEDAARLKRLGFKTIGQLYGLPRAALTRRFGRNLVLRLDQALGSLPELIVPRVPVEPYSESLHCPDGIATAEGIASALQTLLNRICAQLDADAKGARHLVFTGIRLDGKVERIEVGTGLPSRNPTHLYKLFADKLDRIEPALGIEVFTLHASHIDVITAEQQSMPTAAARDGSAMPELIDRIANRAGQDAVERFVPAERHWPEYSLGRAQGLAAPVASWTTGKPRPLCLLPHPEPIEVTAPVPDDPPVMFRRQNRQAYRIRCADGPERIEREWWLQDGQPRDYYRVEDMDGHRYWVFRSGHYSAEQPARWFLHGYFP